MTQEQRENAIELVRAVNTPDEATPETDAAMIEAESEYSADAFEVLHCLCRRLERERDALRHKLADLQSSHDAAWARFNEIDAAYQAALEDRDRYRRAIEEALHVLEMPRAGQYAKYIDVSVAKTWLQNALAGKESA
jgi:hypothetical protein